MVARRGERVQDMTLRLISDIMLPEQTSKMGKLYVGMATLTADYTDHYLRHPSHVAVITLTFYSNWKMRMCSADRQPFCVLTVGCWTLMLPGDWNHHNTESLSVWKAQTPL